MTWEDEGWMSGRVGRSDMEDRTVSIPIEPSGAELNARIKGSNVSLAKDGPQELRSVKALLGPPAPPINPPRGIATTGEDDDEFTSGGWPEMGKNKHRHKHFTQRGPTRYPVAIFDKTGELVDVANGESYPHTYGKLVEFFGIVKLKDDGPDILACDLDMYREKKVYRNKNFKPGPCLFDSTSAFLEAILGKRVHNTDKTYFDNHPLTVEHGTPMPYTARIVQEIVSPYGLRVCRIRMNKNHPVPGELRDWMTYLGCNPFAAENSETTNAEFAAMTGQSVEAVNQQFAFDFDTVPLAPSVICEATKTTHYASSGVGHASYHAPRRKAYDWWVSLQIDASPWPYAVKPVYEEYVLEEAYEADFSGILQAVEAYERARKAHEAQTQHAEQQA